VREAVDRSFWYSDGFHFEHLLALWKDVGTVR